MNNMDIETLTLRYGVMYHSAVDAKIDPSSFMGYRSFAFLSSKHAMLDESVNLAKIVADNESVDAATRKLAQQYLDDLNAL